MNVELPTTGCNIINSSTSFYNYSPDGRTRDSYVIYEGKAYLQSSSYSQYGYSYSGTCLVTGDLKFKPDVTVYFPLICFCMCCALLIFIYHLFIKRLFP